MVRMMDAQLADSMEMSAMTWEHHLVVQLAEQSALICLDDWWV